MITPADYGDVRFFRMARTFGGRAIYWTGVYFLDGLLIDSGPANLRREVRTLFRDLGIRACVTTHHHEDHTGNHALLAEDFGIVPMAHSAATGRLARPDRLHLYRRLAWGHPPPAGCQALSDEIQTGRFRLRAVHTPGHSDDHVVLHEPDRGWLFAGDLYLGPRLTYLRSDEDVHALMDSLRRAIALEPQVLFCQHRGRIDNGAAALRRKLDSMCELQQRVEQLHAKGLPPEQIARALPGRDFLWRVCTAGHFSKLNFVRAFLRPRTPGRS